MSVLDQIVDVLTYAMYFFTLAATLSNFEFFDSHLSRLVNAFIDVCESAPAARVSECSYVNACHV